MTESNTVMLAIYRIRQTSLRNLTQIYWQSEESNTEMWTTPQSLEQLQGTPVESGG
jgi:hypothetical protein